MSIRVYLDSSDYSTLSDRNRAEREAPGVLKELLTLRDSGKVSFYFSAAHLTEMAPLKPHYTGAAVQRSNLLTDLCNGNCMIHMQSLFKEEVSNAMGISFGPIHPFDKNGKWFPDGACDLLPIPETEHLQYIKKVITESIPEVNRKQRRQALKRATKGGKLDPSLRELLLQNAESLDLNVIQATLPMRSDAARTLARYVAGGATSAEATAAFESSLRDPRWVMQWFEKHYDDLTPFISWARGPAVDIANTMLKLYLLIDSTRTSQPKDIDFATSLYGPSKWDEIQKNTLEKVANRFANEINPGTKLEITSIDAHCFGLSTAIRTLHSAWRSITFDRPRRPKDSDFVDALHAIYAPYVDIFRADAFMSIHISKQVSKFGTVVVPKLSDLPKVIHTKVAAS